MIEERERAAAVRGYGKLNVYLTNIPNICGNIEMRRALSNTNIFRIRTSSFSGK